MSKRVLILPLYDGGNVYLDPYEVRAVEGVEERPDMAARGALAHLTLRLDARDYWLRCDAQSVKYEMDKLIAGTGYCYPAS